MFSLVGKNALVTGAGSGIGAAIAKTLALAGARVWALDIEASRVEETIASIRASGGHADAAGVDVSSDGDMLALATQLPALDVLVNNAGIGCIGDLLKTSALDLDRLYAVNVRGVLNGCKAFVPAMLERRSGSVINMASIAGIIAVRERLAYTTTKFAVVGLTKALALDHSHMGVRFNAICPGRVETPWIQQRLRESPDPEAAYKEMAATQLSGRMVRPEEVAAAALYLAADESAMVTGSCQIIDGGWSAGK